MDRKLASGCASAGKDGKRGRNSAKQTSLAAGTRYKLPEIQGHIFNFNLRNTADSVSNGRLREVKNN